MIRDCENKNGSSGGKNLNMGRIDTKTVLPKLSEEPECLIFSTKHAKAVSM